MPGSIFLGFSDGGWSADIGMLILFCAWQVIVMVPGYQSLSEIATAMGCSVKTWEPSLEPDGSMVFDVNELADKISNKTRVRFLIN